MQKYIYSHCFLMIFKNDVFSKEGSRGGVPIQKNDGFRALRVPEGSLGGVSSRLVGPWGLQEPLVRFFVGARGVPLERPRYVPLQIMSIKSSVF